MTSSVHKRLDFYVYDSVAMSRTTRYVTRDVFHTLRWTFERPVLRQFRNIADLVELGEPK